MRLNLSGIINVPGSSVSFDYEPDVSGLVFESVAEFVRPLRASGSVRNTAGVLTLSAEITADLCCVCARCLKEFEKHIQLPCEAVLAESIQNEEESDAYLLDGDEADLDEVLLTAFVLNMDQRFLCREDCKGLCERCGKDLNEGPCGCMQEIDPRLAALSRFLEDE